MAGLNFVQTVARFTRLCKHDMNEEDLDPKPEEPIEPQPEPEPEYIRASDMDKVMGHGGISRRTNRQPSAIV